MVYRFYTCMHISEEEFMHQFKETLDTLLQNMAEDSEISVRKFYHMTYFMENLSFFSPVIFDLIQKSKK